MNKIIYCVVVCTAIISCDVYGMKRKADGQPEGQQDGRKVRQRITGPEPKAPASEQPEVKSLDTETSDVQDTCVPFTTVDGKYSVQIRVAWFDESLVINANPYDQRKEAVENLKIRFEDQEELEIFRKMLQLLNKPENKKLVVPRQRAKIIADNVKKMPLERAAKMMQVSEYLQIPVLSLAWAMYIASRFFNHKADLHYFDEDFDYPKELKALIAREIRFMKEQETDKDLKYADMHGFVRFSVKDSKASYDGDEEKDEDKDKDKQQIVAQKLFNGLLEDSQRKKFIKQLPQSFVELVVLEKCTTPGFMVSDWIVGLTPFEVTEVVNKLYQKARIFVGTPEDEELADEEWAAELKSRFDKLPENYFKMAVRYVYTSLVKGWDSVDRTLDDLVSFRFLRKMEDRFTGEGYDRTDWSDCNITTLDIFTDFLLVFDKIHPIEWLLLGDNNISDIKGLVKILVKLKNLNALDLCNNEITCIQGIDALVNLKWLWLHGNQIARIEGLDALQDLIELHLDSNQIARIEGLDALENLREIDLSDNPELANQPGFDAIVQALRNRGIDVTIE